METRIEMSYFHMRKHESPPTTLFTPVHSAAPVTVQHSDPDHPQPIELEKHARHTIHPGIIRTLNTPEKLIAVSGSSLNFPLAGER